MKTLVLILGLVFSMNSFAQNNSDYYFDPISPNSGSNFDIKATQARELARKWMITYALKYKDHFSTNEKDGYEIKYMIDGLANINITKLNPSRARTAKTNCSETRNLYAYIPSPFRNLIKLCNTVFDFDVNQIAELFVHESYHVSENLVNDLNDKGITRVRFRNDDIKKEVAAVSYEIAILNQITGGCKYIYIGYFDLEPYASILEKANIVDPNYCDGYASRQAPNQSLTSY